MVTYLSDSYENYKAMELTCKLLLYFDQRHYLADMKNQCEKFSDEQRNDQTLNKFPPLRFLLEIDVMDILDTFPEVADILLKEPLRFQRICSDILYALRIAKEDSQNVKPTQLAALVRLKSLPNLLTPPNIRRFSGLSLFEGILISVSNPTSYVYHTVWSCPEECDGSEVILHYIPKAPPKCYVCRNVLFENGGLRRTGEQVTATFKLKKDICSRDFKIVDDLIPRLALGLKYSIHAIVMKKLTDVWSLEKITPLPAHITCPIPKDIEELYQVCNGIPWTFIYCLASSIGLNISPLNCFMHLKISLLMSLSSVKANMAIGSNIVHVLVAGFDTRYVREIMADGARLADQSFFLGTSHTVVSTALLASSGGVCVMPLPLHVYNHKLTSAALAAIETGEVTTDTYKAKLHSAVWAQGMDFKKIVLCNVASVFGTVCRGDLGKYDDEIADFVLQNAIEPVETSEEELQALKDVTLYIDLVAGTEVTLDVATETLLRNYFLSARGERTRGITVSSMNALVATCVTSARLCRRTVAHVDDAVLAIWLHVSGGPEPRFAPEEYLQTPAGAKEFHKMMSSFKEWLGHFAGTYLL